jgi:hypothetical protein
LDRLVSRFVFGDGTSDGVKLAANALVNYKRVE